MEKIIVQMNQTYFLINFFLYLKIYIIIFKYLSICKIEELIFFSIFYQWKLLEAQKDLLSLLLLNLTHL